MRIVISSAVVILALASGCAHGPTPAQDIQVIATTSSTVEASDAYGRLYAAGVDAFPALVARLDDHSTIPTDIFNADILAIQADGSASAYRASVADACFEILQGQIEGNWPKGFRQYYVLTPSNVADWLGRHRGASLEQLRGFATSESLAKVDRDIAAHPESEYPRLAREFILRPYAERQ